MSTYPTSKAHRFDYQWVSCLDCGTKRHAILRSGDWECRPSPERAKLAPQMPTDAIPASTLAVGSSPLEQNAPAPSSEGLDP